MLEVSHFNGRSGPGCAHNALQQHGFSRWGPRTGGFRASKCETWMTESHGVGPVRRWHSVYLALIGRGQGSIRAVVSGKG